MQKNIKLLTLVFLATLLQAKTDEKFEDKLKRFKAEEAAELVEKKAKTDAIIAAVFDGSYQSAFTELYNGLVWFCLMMNDKEKAEIAKGTGSSRYALSRLNRLLLEAAENNDLKIVKILLDADADLDKNITDEKGFTPLHYAAKNNNPEMVRMLLDAGADKTIPNEKGYTALDLARFYNNKEIIKLLK